MSETRIRPLTETGKAAYSNFDHCLDTEIVAQLESNPGKVCAQHAAWNFCGYIWRLPDGCWVDQVWVYNNPVQDIIGGSIEDVIERANVGYGSE